MSDYRPHDRDRRGSRNGGGGDYYDAPPPPSSSFRDGGRPYPPPPRDDFYDDRGPPPPRRGGDDRRGGDFGGGGGRRGGGGGGYDDRRGGYRGGYDDDRVGPMRSPEYERGDGGRGKRRRSPSPAFRRGGDFDDRPPRGDNGDFRGPPPRFRDDRRGPPRGGRDFDSRDGPPPPPSRPSLEAPHTLPYQVTLSYFRDWFAQTSPPSLVSSPTALDEAWKKYEADFLRRDAKGPFEAHRGERWFRDKYEPGKEMEEERRERRKVAREGRVKEWVERAKNGELDGVAYDFDEELVRRRAAIQPNEATLAALGKSGSPSLPQNGTTTTTSTEVKTDDASMPPAGEADVKPKTESTPKIKDSSLPPTEIAPKVSQANPEMIVVPAKPEQICVARVPPEVSIKELESLFTPFDGFTRLAVSAAAPHAGFLRLAWATFSTAEQAKAAMDTIAAAAVKPEEPAATGEAKVEGTKDGEEKPSVTGAENGDGEMTNGDAPSTTAAAAPSDPKDTPLDPSALPFTPASTASSVPYSIGSYTLTAPSILSILTVPFEARIRATPSLLSSAERVRDELEKVGRVVEALESQAEADGSIAKEGEGEGRGQRGSEVLRSKREGWERELEGRKEKEGLGEKEVEKEKVEIAKRSLDLSLSYLRAAFDTCYYCCVVCDSPEQLADLCPRHVRRADNGGNEARRGNEAAWLTGFDKRLPLLFPRTSIDIRDFGGESRDEELYRLVQPHVKQEEEGKFRCKECSKLFSARKFVEKHIALKHGEFIGPALEKVDFFNNYILDPSRLPLAQFQRENYLPSILAPPPPPRRSGGLADRIGPKRPRIEPRELDGPRGPPPPPPAGQKMDPRAGRGASSYADLDGAPGGGDIVLPY